ncbi:hypothetical protein N9027_00220, partial [bacterium]|nr:hypothetical protein [bacterium]
AMGIKYLSVMLEGQVAILSSGMLASAEGCEARAWCVEAHRLIFSTLIANFRASWRRTSLALSSLRAFLL